MFMWCLGRWRQYVLTLLTRIEYHGINALKHLQARGIFYRKYIKSIAAGRDHFWRPVKSMQFQDTGPETDLTLFVLNSSANTVITIHKMKNKNHIEQHQEGNYHSVNHNKITTNLHRITNNTTSKFNGLLGFTLLWH